ncbi:MAG TPA: YecA family protein [Bradyrhizobium sp.]|uniref:YecA/YgfB family protein n=1 Tax=Bradyrhizobium sp. TaxID=376 RepID=UPI002C73A4F7|nr:YecA family protein [Bradyrhizobium sp.]HLZ03586.1 YecA family protein [Bradyrhizobium sp.]
MPAQARARAIPDSAIPLDHVDLEALDRFLMSERSPQDSMMLSDLDGFLTGIAVGPELVLPSEWLPAIWGGEAPEFADEAEAKAVLGAIMGRYNEILRQVADDDLDPVFWATRDGTLIAADWAEGFLQAIMLRADAWERLFKSKRDSQLLVPILALCGDENGESLLGISPDEEDPAMEEAAEFIPACVAAIDAYWRAKRPRHLSMPVAAGPPRQSAHTSSEIGRNGPCPCGSGKKFKKCCGKAA